MKQSRVMSLVEAGTNVAVGIGIAFIANGALLRAFGHPISVRDNFTMTLVMTAISIARSYTLRRLFNGWKAPGKNHAN